MKYFDRIIINGLVLSGIGFLYAGIAWTNLPALFINGAQSVIAVFVACYGTKKNIHIFAAVYFLHGIWDMIYHTFQNPNLLPCQYDQFCLVKKIAP